MWWRCVSGAKQTKDERSPEEAFAIKWKHFFSYRAYFKVAEKSTVKANYRVDDDSR